MRTIFTLVGEDRCQFITNQLSDLYTLNNIARALASVLYIFPIQMQSKISKYRTAI